MLADFLADIPNLHTWDGGKTWNTGGFNRRAFEEMQAVITANLQPGASFIETGAGSSTIFFLLQKPAQVISIAPDQPLFDRIGTYCRERSIPTDVLTAVTDGSQWALPKLAAGSEPTVDFALIDGNHGWPMVFVDFQYINYMVKPGGLIMIDDINLYSAAELVAMLKEQPGYALVLQTDKFAVFKKTTENREPPDHFEQPYITRRSQKSPWQLMAAKVRKKVTRIFVPKRGAARLALKR